MRTFHIGARLRVVVSLAIAATVGGGAYAAVAASPAAAAPAAVSHVTGQVPSGFTEHKAKVGALGIDYVIGGHGPTLVLIHGYPQTWYEWRNIMPALAQHYTVIAPDLLGAGMSRPWSPAVWGPAVARAISATVRLLKRSAAEPC